MLTGLYLGFVSLLAGSPSEPGVVAPSVWMSIDQHDVARVWVFLRDKDLQSPKESSAAISRVAQTYPARAVERRRLRRTAPGLFDERDVPVSAPYVCAIEQTGAKTRVESAWVNAVSVVASPAQIGAISRLPFVQRIAPVRRGLTREAVPLQDRPAPGTAAPRDFYGLSESQLAQIHITDLHARGFTGRGVIVGVLDTGFALSHAAYANPAHPIQVIAQWDFINNDGNTGIEPSDPPTQFFHGTAVLGALAAYKPFELIGGAYDASFVLAKTEDVTQEVPAEEDNYVAGLQFIEMHGADVATSSLGYIAWYDWYDLDGETAVTSLAVNVATANGVVCVTGAGNRGRDNDFPSIMAPGDAFDVITCGAARADGDVTDFSSNGPTADGRVKPEVLALGEDVATVDPYSSDGYQHFDGTSMATPLVASAAALLVQAHPNWTVPQIRVRFFQTASYYDAHHTFDPEYARGYGLINALRAARLPQTIRR